MRGRICVAGPGSIGGLLAFLLRSRNPLLIARSPEKKGIIERRGLRIKAWGREHLLRAEARTWNELGRGECMILLFAVKAYDLPCALKEADGVLHPQGLAVSLQNGYGSLEAVEEAYGTARTAGGIVEYGAYRPDPATIVVAGRGGRIVLGHREMPPTPLLHVLADALREGGGEVMLVDDIEPYRRLKTLANAVINPITALARVPNGALAWEKNLRLLAEELLEELLGIPGPTPLPEDPRRYLWRIVEQTRSNYSSMLRDLEEGRRTEIDYINGWLASEAIRLGVPTPINNTLLHLVKGQEAWQARSRRVASEK